MFRKPSNVELQKLYTERKQLKDEGKVILDILKAAKEQLTQLEVEGLEIKARIRNAASKTPTRPIPIVDYAPINPNEVELDLSTKGIHILNQLKAGGMILNDDDEEEDDDDDD